MCKKNIFWVMGIIAIMIFYSNSLSQIPFQLTHEIEGVSDFVWSPDGNQFAYIAMDNGTSRLYRINVDGSNKTLLTSSEAYGGFDWKGKVITFTSSIGPDYYDDVVKRIAPDGSNEATIVGPYWYGTVILRADAKWILYEDAPNGWWQARRCDLNGNNDLVLETYDLVQQVGWFGKNHVIYSRGPNYYTACGIHKVDFNGAGHIQLTSETLPNNALFIASPDTSKILYCDGNAANWDIWVMDADGANKTQLTTDLSHDYLSNTRDNIWSSDAQSFYFVSERSGKGDIYRMNIDGSDLTQMTFHDSLDFMPVPSPDHKRLAFISKQDGVNNIWMLFLNPYISRVSDVPNDQGGHVTVIWQTPYLDSDLGIISFYSIWRALPEGTLPKTSTKQTEVTKDFSGSAYRFNSINGEEYAWEWIANQPAHGFSLYSYTAETLYDSMSTTDGKHFFLVSAHTDESNIFYDSNVGSGYSVDNLPPLPPTGLLASVVNNTIELIWHESPESDLRFYVIYRNGNSYDLTSFTQYQDANVEIGQSYSYKLKAVDVHENESEFSEEVTVTLTHVESDELNLPKVYQLSQNYPNPFNLETLIQYQLPFTSNVELSIYNAAGQKIRTLVKAQENSGYYRVYWDGKDADGFQVPSGIYLYQLRASEFMQTRKMILLK